MSQDIADGRTQIASVRPLGFSGSCRGEPLGCEQLNEDVTHDLEQSEQQARPNRALTPGMSAATPVEYHRVRRMRRSRRLAGRLPVASFWAWVGL